GTGPVDQPVPFLERRLVVRVGVERGQPLRLEHVRGHVASASPATTCTAARYASARSRTTVSPLCTSSLRFAARTQGTPDSRARMAKWDSGLPAVHTTPRRSGKMGDKNVIPPL